LTKILKSEEWDCFTKGFLEGERKISITGYIRVTRGKGYSIFIRLKVGGRPTEMI
jgi:hypothetical protein